MQIDTMIRVPTTAVGPAQTGALDEADAKAAMMRKALELLQRLRVYHPATARHSQQVSRLAMLMRAETTTDLGPPMVVMLSGLLHDIGKLFVPTSILTAERKLTEAELVLMREHSERGAALLEEMEFPAEVVATAREHHERWTGEGYPGGMPSSVLPALSRAVSAADAFSAMIEPRSYCTRKTQDEALAELRSDSGTQFDPEMVDLLHAAIESWGAMAGPAMDGSTTPGIGPDVQKRAAPPPDGEAGIGPRMVVQSQVSRRIHAFQHDNRPFSITDDSGLDFRAIVESSANSVMVTDPDLELPGPTIRFVNAAFTRMTGYDAAMVLGGSPSILHGPRTDQRVLQQIWLQVHQGRSGRGKVVHYNRTGNPYWVDLKIVPLFGRDGRVRQYVGFQSDVTEDQARYDEMRDMALRDALTGVANRRAFLDRLEEHLATADADPLAFAYIDVDHFKQINDTHGHPAGDAVLMGLTEVLGANTRRADLIGRLGGEEFGICMPRIMLPEARALAARLRAGVAAHPFPTPGGPINATCSIGLTMSRPGDGVANLLARADQALYRAKRGGRNRVCVG